MSSDDQPQFIGQPQYIDQRQCHDEVCITCSDAAVAVRILRLLDDELAVVDTGAGEEEVSVALVSANVGDTILVHAREAIAVVPG
ncbi:MAG TPA: HypC/HybG/HupF family hydrogenase formation chaperone [Streptosporangiaceae bacterium]|jgi:hydrogenase expression/formation protein HypC